MPNRRTHIAIGAATSGITALISSENLPDDARLIFFTFALFGGAAGGRLPDIIEPAIHPGHRDLFHSMLAGGGVFWLESRAQRIYGEPLLARALQWRAERMSLPPEDPRCPGLRLREYASYAVAGLMQGLAVGYTSHLIADMTTPKSIPLVMRGLA